jgi:hypothetical protein
MTERNKKWLLSIVFLFCYLMAVSQPGHPYITNISLQYALDNQIFAITQGANGDMFFTNRSGILHYDGQEWDLILCTGLPVSLSKPVQGKVFVGCENNAGYIEKDQKGVYTFYPIINTSDSLAKALKGNYSKIIIIDSSVFFCSEKDIIVVNKNNNKITKHLDDSNFINSGIFDYNKTLYINIRGKGLHYYHNQYLFAFRYNFLF